MRYLLDTNIVYGWIKKYDFRQNIEKSFKPFSPANTPIISIVTVGEINALALANGWGKRTRRDLESFLKRLVIIDINSEDILQRYAEIYAFSQGRHPEKPLSSSARNMGKNDLWIAATASVVNGTLITTDKDFDHLHDEFLKLALVAV